MQAATSWIEEAERRSGELEDTDTAKEEAEKNKKEIDPGAGKENSRPECYNQTEQHPYHRNS